MSVALAAEAPRLPRAAKPPVTDRFATLHTFMVAAELLSFTAAGRQLAVSSSAVGKVIGRLEDRLGVRLFHRNTRNVALTGEGELFLTRCRSIFQELEAAELELARSAAEPRGRLRIAVPPLGAALTAPLAAFALAYPEIELDLEITDRAVDVIGERFDAVLRLGEASDSQLITRSLGEMTHRLVAAPAYLAMRGRPETPEDLLEFDGLLRRWPASGQVEPWPLRRDGQDLNLAIPMRLAASEIAPLIALAEAGLGIACVPEICVGRQLEEGRLVALLDGYVQGATTLRLLWPSSRHRSHKVKAFVDFMSLRLPPALRGAGPRAFSG